MRAIRLALLFLLLPAIAQAGTVTAISDATTLQIDLTQRVRIADILVPRQIASETARQLQSVLLNQPVTLSGSHTDPTGTTMASVLRVDGEDVGRRLVSHGLAIVWPLQGRDEQALLKLLQAEGEARNRKAGLWADPDTIATPETAQRLLHGYGIVEGTVTAAAGVKGRFYLNFGPDPKTDWKTDFTAQLTKEAATRLQMPPYKISWLDLKGRRVRVRGWVEPRGGPMIMVASPLQLEVLP